MTYHTLLTALMELTDEQLDMTASVLMDGEVYPVDDTYLAGELEPRQRLEIEDVVDPQQPLLVI